MNKEYLITGKVLNVYDENQKLHKAELEHNVDVGEILALENRIEFLLDIFSEKVEECLSDSLLIADKEVYRRGIAYKSLFLAIVSSVCLTPINVVTGYPVSSAPYIVAPIISSIVSKRKIHQKEMQCESLNAVIALCGNEVAKSTDELQQLHDSKYDGELMRNDWIPVRDDNEYNADFLDRVEMFSEYGKRKREMIDKAHNNLLNQYLDSMGCSEVDKSIFRSLLGDETANASQKHSFTKNVYVKK